MKRLLLVLTISLTSFIADPQGVDADTYDDTVEPPQVEFPEVVLFGWEGELFALEL